MASQSDVMMLNHCPMNALQPVKTPAHSGRCFRAYFRKGKLPAHPKHWGESNKLKVHKDACFWYYYCRKWEQFDILNYWINIAIHLPNSNVWLMYRGRCPPHHATLCFISRIRTVFFVVTIRKLWKIVAQLLRCQLADNLDSTLHYKNVTLL